VETGPWASEMPASVPGLHAAKFMEELAFWLMPVLFAFTLLVGREEEIRL